MLRRLRTVLACALVVAAAGCGGSDTAGSVSGTESAATIAPASAAGYVGVDTDLESAQWKQARELIDRFPGRDMLFDALERELGEEDVDFDRDVAPALGPETALVFLTSAEEPVVLTQPDDKAKLEALLDRSDEEYVTREIEGWTAIAETAAELDAFERAREQGTLADEEQFQEAVGELPEEAIAKAYVAGKALEGAADDLSSGSAGIVTGGGRVIFVAAGLEARDDGVVLGGIARFEGGTRPEAYEPALLDRVPGDALAVISFRELDKTIDQARSAEAFGRSVGQIEQLLGIGLDDLGKLFGSESILYVRAGSPIPEVTLLLDVENESEATETLRQLAARVAPLVGGKTGTIEVDGVQASYVDVQGVRIAYASFDGLVAITTGAAGLRDARRDDDKLPDDERFQAAQEAAGMGDTTGGFVYVDLKDAIPLLEGFASLADESIPDEVSENLAPLESFLVNASPDGDTVGFGSFLGVESS